eukprot:TRINITY_DN3918_c0_g1_i7.p1 TRINITY_DN3918_c0_g1~~TRINITY_DN3918_c0_g1_i7.p1  ORF type:complete len:203 (+),score=-16.77 TRINITY_DN3918_c0_g1_i7:877-1485(+)
MQAIPYQIDFCFEEHFLMYKYRIMKLVHQQTFLIQLIVQLKFQATSKYYSCASNNQKYQVSQFQKQSRQLFCYTLQTSSFRNRYKSARTKVYVSMNVYTEVHLITTLPVPENLAPLYRLPLQSVLVFQESTAIQAVPLQRTPLQCMTPIYTLQFQDVPKKAFSWCALRSNTDSCIGSTKSRCCDSSSIRYNRRGNKATILIG